jgi:integrase
MGQFGSGTIMKDPRKRLDKDEWTALIKACPRERDKMIVFTLAMTGRRISEVVRQLKPSDIDYRDGLINWTILKRRRPTKKLIPANPMLLKNISRYIRKNRIGQDEYVFPISRQRMDQILKEAAAKVGLQFCHSRMLRHGFAVNIVKHHLKRFDDIVLLQRQLAHENIQNTMEYLSFYPGEQKDLIASVWTEESQPEKQPPTESPGGTGQPPRRPRDSR